MNCRRNHWPTGKLSKKRDNWQKMMTKRKKKEHDIPNLFTENVAFIHCTASTILFTIETSFCFGKQQHIFHFGYEKKYSRFCQKLWDALRADRADCSRKKWMFFAKMRKIYHQIQILPYQIRSNFFSSENFPISRIAYRWMSTSSSLFFRPFFMTPTDSNVC